MTPVFEPNQPAAPAEPAEPRDAATLILVRGGREVLLGQRPQGSVFMPNKWVFPGGRVEDEDALAPAATEFLPETEALLQLQAQDRAVRAFGLAAARETLEETGLQVGGADGPRLCRFHFLARAITPPGRTRRFDARFFLASAEEVLAYDVPVVGDELMHIRWFSFAEAETLDLPIVTRFVLGEAQARLNGELRAPAFARTDGERSLLTRLGESGQAPGIE